MDGDNVSCIGVTMMCIVARGNLNDFNLYLPNCIIFVILWSRGNTIYFVGSLTKLYYLYNVLASP